MVFWPYETRAVLSALTPEEALIKMRGMISHSSILAAGLLTPDGRYAGAFNGFRFTIQRVVWYEFAPRISGQIFAHDSGSMLLFRFFCPAGFVVTFAIILMMIDAMVQEPFPNALLAILALSATLGFIALKLQFFWMEIARFWVQIRGEF